MRRVIMSKIDAVLKLPQEIIKVLGANKDIVFNIEFYSKGCEDRNTLILDIQSPYAKSILASVLVEKGVHSYYFSTPKSKEERIKTRDELLDRILKVCNEYLEVNK